MIKRLTYKEIDFSRYQTCLANSVQKNIYAKKEVLDLLCDSWELLVFGNYEWVMPIPIAKKLGFKIVVMPLFCQQLGIFGARKDEKIELQFLDEFQKKYKILFYAFNFQNEFVPALKMKKNYVIQKQEYQPLRKNYFKGRKSTVKTAQYLQFKEVQRKDVLNFIKENFRGLEKQTDLEKFLGYMQFLDEQKKLRIFASYKDFDLTNLAIIIEDENRYSLLGLINDEEFKTDNGASFLIDRILQNTISEKSFDFMGGNIRGIEVFFKSFGSQLQEYPLIENSKKDLLKNLFRK